MSGWTLIADFDGTIVEQVVPELLDAHFGVCDPIPIDEAYRSGQIDVVEHVAGRFACLRARPGQIVSVVTQEVTIRPGVAEVVQFCRTRNIRLRVLSSSLDTYVMLLLRPLGFLEQEIVCSRAMFAGDRIIAIAPPSRNGLDFKSAAVCDELAMGQRVLYVGDGSNDRAAAHLATFVLARRRLLAYCRERGVRHAPFEDFWDVLAWVKKALGTA